MSLLKTLCFFAFVVSTYLPFPNGAPINSSKQESNTPAQQKNQPDPTTPNVKEERPKNNATRRGDIQILSDTMGIDFGPYLHDVVPQIREHWYSLIPESAKSPVKKQGEVVIEFAILKDGKVAGLKIQKSSGDQALDRPAFGAITKANPLPPLPANFTGQFLYLRFTFQYNPENKPSEPAPPK